MLKVFITACLINFSLLFFSLNLFGQIETQRFDITSADEVVGHLIATKKVEKEITVYEIYSDVTIQVIFKLRMINEIKAVFKNNVLIRSNATLQLNDRSYSDCQIEKQNGFYSMEYDGDKSIIELQEITSSSAKLYWKKPLAEKYSLSETEGEMRQVDRKAAQQFALSAEGSKRNVSLYKYSESAGLHMINVMRPLAPALAIIKTKNNTQKSNNH